MKIQNGVSLKPLSAEARAEKQDGALKDAAKMYEDHFLNEMVKAMRSTVGQEDGLVKRSFGEKLFTDQLDQKYVEGWSNKGGVGLADMIYTQVKDKYFATQGKHMHNIKQMMPIAPKREMHGIESPDSIQMKAIPPTPGGAKVGYRFEVPNPSSGRFEVQAPMPGKVAEIKRLEQNWNSLRLDHGEGMESELTFPGQIEPELSLGSNVGAGQKLGMLDSSRPALAWNLDWT